MPAAVHRLARFSVQEGHGGDVVGRLLAAAEVLRAAPGCLLYLVSRQADAPDVVWVTELWRDQEALEAASAGAGEDPDVAAVLAVLSDYGVTELELAGGVGAD